MAPDIAESLPRGGIKGKGQSERWTVEKLAGDLDELRREVRDHHHEREEEARRANEKLVRIEDRTKRS